MDIKEIDLVLESLKTKDNFLIITHRNYDYDAFSSVFSLALILKNLNKNFYIFFDEGIQDNLKNFIEEVEDKIISEKEIKDKKIENIITVDTAQIEFLMYNNENFLKEKFIINIDHHNSNRNFGNINFVIVNAASATNIIFYLAENLNLINRKIAELILLGILSDSLILTTHKVNKESFRIVLKLFDFEIDYQKIIKILSLFSYNNLLLEKELIEKFKIINGKIGLLVLENYNQYNKEQQKFIRYFKDYLNRLKELEVILVLIEKENLIRVNLRSKNEKLDVSYLAMKYFNGGGHKNAAGGELFMKLDEAINYALNVIENYLKENVT